MYFFGLLESVAPLKEKLFANSPKFNFDVCMCTAYQLWSCVLSCLSSLESCYFLVSLGMSEYSIIWSRYHKNIINNCPTLFLVQCFFFSFLQPLNYSTIAKCFITPRVYFHIWNTFLPCCHLWCVNDRFTATSVERLEEFHHQILK